MAANRKATLKSVTDQNPGAIRNPTAADEFVILECNRSEPGSNPQRLTGEPAQAGECNRSEPGSNPQRANHAGTGLL